MRRREFMAFVGGASAWPLAARAQPGERMRRVGVLVSGAEGDPEMQARLTGFRQGLERLGWSEGRNIQIDYRYGTAGLERTQTVASELVALRPDLLLAMATTSTLALQRETREIPIVFVGIADPIGLGLVASLARPGGNITGLLLYEETIVGKWLAMLKETTPALRRVAWLDNPKLREGTYQKVAASIAPALAIELVPAPVENAADIVSEVEAFARAPNGALLVPPNLTAVLHRDLIIALAARHRLPAVYQARFWVAAGGLMSYGSDRVAEHRKAAYYVDRILRGTDPSDLPVEAPAKFETIVNLKTANALGLMFPPSLLVAADEVIE